MGHAAWTKVQICQNKVKQDFIMKYHPKVKSIPNFILSLFFFLSLKC